MNGLGTGDWQTGDWGLETGDWGLGMRSTQTAEVGLLLTILDQAYDHPSWHGTNLRGSIRRVSLEQAAWRPGPQRHNIWETMVHAAYWKYTAWRRLTGTKRGSFPLVGSNWFRRPEDMTERAWRSDVELLERMHVAVARSRRTAVHWRSACDSSREQGKQYRTPVRRCGSRSVSRRPDPAAEAAFEVTREGLLQFMRATCTPSRHRSPRQARHRQPSLASS